MAGSVLITGANGSVAIHAVEHLLRSYPQFTAILTVRDASDADVNTRKLREKIAQFPNAKAFIHPLDLTSLSAVHKLAATVAAGVSSGQYPPLRAIIANAYYWNLVSDAEITGDGFDKTFQIGHVAHVALVLPLLGSFGPEGGHVVLFSSDAHWPGKNGLEKIPPAIPDDDDLELLVKPKVTTTDDKSASGFHKYANTKLAIVMWMYALDRRLQKDPSLGKVNVVAINPGNLVDSRALLTNTPKSLAFLQKFVLRPFLPLLRLKDHTMRHVGPAGVDVIELAVGPEHVGDRGYYTLLQKDESSPDSRDERKQEALWKKSLEWAVITKENTSLVHAFD